MDPHDLALCPEASRMMGTIVPESLLRGQGGMTESIVEGLIANEENHRVCQDVRMSGYHETNVA